MPLLEVVASTGGLSFTHNGGTCVNVGTVGWITVMSIVVVVAHSLAAGVNVYVPDAVLLTVAGDQVPEILLIEVVGSVGAVVPAQKGAIWVKVGVIG